MKKALRIILFSLLGLIVLAAGFLCAVPLYLTPERLGKIIDKEMSGYFNADVRIKNPRFTFWSTFPRFTLETDSVIIISHTLDSLPAKELKGLPGDPRLLATAQSLKGGINIINLAKGKYDMHDLEVTELHLNIVAVNDSVNNYDIMPKNDPSGKVPYFTTNLLTFKRPKGISVYFASSDTRGQIELDSVVMRRLKTETDYDLALKGRISAVTERLHIFNDMPFYLHGDMDLDFNPFGIKFHNFDVDLASMKSNLNMSLGLEGNMKIDKFDYHISAANLIRLLNEIPWLPLANLRAFTTDLEVNISATLDRPYTFSSGELPWVTIKFDIPGGTLQYKTEGGTNVKMDYSPLGAGLIFNGERPDQSYMYLDPVTVSVPGARISVHGNMTDLLDSPDIKLYFEGRSDLNSLAESYKPLKSWGTGGELSFKGSASGILPELDAKGIQEGLKELSFEAEAEVDKVHFDIEGYDFKAGKINIKAVSSKLARGLDDLPNAKINLKASASDASLVSPSGEEKYNTLELNAETVISNLWAADKEIKAGPFNIKAAHFDLTFPDVGEFALENVSASYGGLPPKRYLPDARPAPKSPYFAVKASSGIFKLNNQKVPFRLGNVDVFYSPDSLAVNNIGIHCLSTYADVQGELINLDEFLKSDMKAPLEARVKIACDTINVNQLAHSFYKGGKSGRKDLMSGIADTVPVVIPGNITATLDFSGKESIYTNLHLYDLNGHLRVKDGRATVDNLNIDADFGHANIGIDYDTSDLQNLRLSTDVSLENIDLVRFFKNFHTLLLMMPQMKNLDGNVSLALSGSMSLFPDMYINMPSLHADIKLAGKDLTLHRNDFINRLAHKLLIKGDKDLHINDMEIKAYVRNNLLELYPFNFEIENYKLRALGTNNFNGDMYYHIDVMKSPLPFSFGINVEGEFKHPHIRFGKPHYNVRKGEEITLDNEVALRMNMVHEVLHFAREFIRKAAESN